MISVSSYVSKRLQGMSISEIAQAMHETEDDLRCWEEGILKASAADVLYELAMMFDAYSSLDPSGEETLENAMAIECLLLHVRILRDFLYGPTSFDHTARKMRLKKSTDAQDQNNVYAFLFITPQWRNDLGIPSIFSTSWVKINQRLAHLSASRAQSTSAWPECEDLVVGIGYTFFLDFLESPNQQHKEWFPLTSEERYALAHLSCFMKSDKCLKLSWYEHLKGKFALGVSETASETHQADASGKDEMLPHRSATMSDRPIHEI